MSASRCSAIQLEPLTGQPSPEMFSCLLRVGLIWRSKSVLPASVSRRSSPNEMAMIIPFRLGLSQIS